MRAITALPPNCLSKTCKPFSTIFVGKDKIKKYNGFVNQRKSEIYRQIAVPNSIVYFLLYFWAGNIDCQVTTVFCSRFVNWKSVFLCQQKLEKKVKFTFILILIQIDAYNLIVELLFLDFQSSYKLIKYSIQKSAVLFRKYLNKF